ncbi:hypothetical protein N0V94_000281 [Neodidymelliopsis sp. IMI 364377]|nr:hypothetical protein N0V94_000281 [Neodidymelliopsis sp. IMI 364377]
MSSQPHVPHIAERDKKDYIMSGKEEEEEMNKEEAEATFASLDALLTSLEPAVADVTLVEIPESAGSNELTEYTVPKTSFQLMKLPGEIRTQIFAIVLAIGRPILPHLCENEKKDGSPIFHDGNAPDYDSIVEILNLTCVSKKIRGESLPLFYSTNTFTTGPDTVTYFVYLEHVGRFEWIRCVQFDVSFQSEKYAAWVLRCVNQFDESVKRHDRTKLRRKSLFGVYTSPDNDDAHKSGRKPVLLTAAQLRSHPRFFIGGISSLNLAVLVRMLSSASTPGSEYTNRIVLPLKTAEPFNTYHRLKWFLSMVDGLSMELRFLVGRPAGSFSNRGVVMEWHRRYQGKEFVKETVAMPQDDIVQGSGSGGDVLKRALDKYPDLEQMRRPTKTSFYRRECHNTQPGSMIWYELETMGGGRWG